MRCIDEDQAGDETSVPLNVPVFSRVGLKHTLFQFSSQTFWEHRHRMGLQDFQNKTVDYVSAGELRGIFRVSQSRATPLRVLAVFLSEISIVYS